MIRKLRETDFLSRANVFSSYLWFISVIVFVYVMLISTKGFTHDPCYGPGCPENVYLLPMLASLFCGVLFFSSMILSGLLRFVLKSEKYKPIFGINAWKMTLMAFLVLLFFGVYLIGTLRSFVRWGGSYTGEDLFVAINNQRLSVGVKKIDLSQQLCDNLVSRWKSVKDGKQHEGFEEWIKQEGIQTDYGYKLIAELYVQAFTPAEAISFWEGSPGHKSVLEDSKWTDGCTYANDGYGVAILGFK